MKYSTILCFLSSIIIGSAAPVEKRQSAPTDADILQYALTLEHLEATFYANALAQFDEAAFDAAGFTGVREYVTMIGLHEIAHVNFLTGILDSILRY
jgi:Ferritin-like domain